MHHGDGASHQHHPAPRHEPANATSSSQTLPTTSPLSADHHLTPPRNAPSSVHPVPTYMPVNASTRHVVVYHPARPHQGSVVYSPTQRTRSHPYPQPSNQAHVIQALPTFAAQYPSPQQQGFQQTAYSAIPAPTPQPPLVYQQPSAQQSPPYIAYYSVPTSQHQRQVQGAPLPPSQIPEEPSENPAYETATFVQQPHPTILVPAQPGSYLPRPNAHQQQRTVVRGSYYHPDAPGTTVVVPQHETDQVTASTPVDYEAQGHAISSSISPPIAPIPVQEHIAVPAVPVPAPYTANRPEPVPDGLRTVQVVAQVSQGTAYPIAAPAQVAVAAPVVYSRMHPPPHPASLVPRRDVAIPVQAQQMTTTVTPAAQAQLFPPGLAPIPPQPHPPPYVPPPVLHQQGPNLRDYRPSTYPGQSDAYGNPVGLPGVYMGPGTVHHYVTHPPTPKKRRLQWTPELHAKFEAAVAEVGIDAAVPKTLLQAMNEPTLTRENVASHLQKYREMMRKRKTEEDDGRSGSDRTRKRGVADLREASSSRDDLEGGPASRTERGSGSPESRGRPTQHREQQPAEATPSATGRPQASDRSPRVENRSDRQSSDASIDNEDAERWRHDRHSKRQRRHHEETVSPSGKRRLDATKQSLLDETGSSPLPDVANDIIATGDEPPHEDQHSFRREGEKAPQSHAGTLKSNLLGEGRQDGRLSGPKQRSEDANT